MELVQKMLSTRGGTIALGGMAAVLAAFILLLYLNQYRDSVVAESEPVTVLVAQQLTIGDFAATSGAIGATLAAKQRAMSVPLDSARGMIGKAEAGDRVDVLA